MSRDTPSSAATAPIVPPPADRNTIRARIANACDVFRLRAHASNVARSSSVNTTGSAFGLGTTPRYKLQAN
jgi:hypothetical protein